MRGVKIHFSNGRSSTFGKAEDRHQGSITLNYASGEYVTHLSIWGNGAGTRCGAFRIRTNKGQDYFPKMYKWGLKTEYPMQVGSGIVLGAWGRHGGDIDSLGFLMLRKIIGTDLVNVNYNLRGGNLNPPQKKSVWDVSIPNPSDKDSDSGFHRVTKERQNSGSWSVTTGVTFGQEYKVSGGVPFVAEGETTTNWQISVSGTYESSWVGTDKLETSIPLILPARETTRYTIDYYEGNINKLPYTGRMKYFLDNHSSFYTDVRGVYDGYSSSKIIVNSELVAVWNDAAGRWERVSTLDRRRRRTRRVY